MRKQPDPLYLSYYLLRCAADKRRNQARREKFRQAAAVLRDLDLKLANIERENHDNDSENERY
jgi:hypothetical protein